MPDAVGPFTGRLGFGARPSLVVIDMVSAYVDPACDLYMGPQGTEVVASIVQLVDAARSASVPIIYTGVQIEPDGRNAGVFFRKVPSLSIFLDPVFGTLVPELAPKPDELYLAKQYPSAFAGTSLAAMLAADRVDSTILCGVSTSGCVRATATDAMQHGFAPLVVRQAVGDRHDGPHEANLFDIDAKIGDVVSLDETLNYLADHQPSPSHNGS